MSDPNSSENKPGPSDEGWLAYVAGFPFSACPYPDECPEAFEWKIAWTAAQDVDHDTRNHSHK